MSKLLAYIHELQKNGFIRKGVDCAVVVLCIAMNWVCSLVLRKTNDNRQLNAAVKTNIRFDKKSPRGCFFPLGGSRTY